MGRLAGKVQQQNWCPHQTAHRPSSAPPPADTKVVAVAAGQQHSLALTAGGEVFSWGNAANGRLGHGSFKRRLFGSSIEFVPRLIRAFEALQVQQVRCCAAVPATPAALARQGSSNAVLVRMQISAGQMHSAAVSSSGDAFLWGYGRFNQLGLGETQDAASPTLLPQLKGRTAALACGSLHTLALLHGGGVMAWGANQASRARHGWRAKSPTCRACSEPVRHNSSRCPRCPRCPLQNGVLGLGHQAQQQPRLPSRVPALSAAQCSAGWKHSAAVTGNGRLYTWGWGGSQGEGPPVMQWQAGGGARDVARAMTGDVPGRALPACRVVAVF